MALFIAAKKTRIGKYLSLGTLSSGLSSLTGGLASTAPSSDPATDRVAFGSGANGYAEPMPPAGPTVVNYSVVHHVKGRVRLRIPQLARDNVVADRLTRLAMALPQVTQVRVNTRVGSVAVHYRGAAEGDRVYRFGDSDRSMLAELVECVRVAAGAELAQNLDASPNAVADDGINYTERLTLPILGLGLSAGVAAGLAIPGVLVGGTILASATPIFQRVAQGIRDEKRLTVDFLDASTIVLLTAQASFLAPAFIVGVIEGSEVTRDWTARRSREAEQDLLMAGDQRALVERSGAQEQISVDDIVPGDILLVYPGDAIAVDGTVLDGDGMVDQHRLTGDSAPVARIQGDSVFATSLVAEGHLRILAQQTGRDTHIAATMATVAAMAKPDTRISNHARKVGNVAVVPTLLVGGAVYASSGSLARMTGILSLDLGTGMRVSAPIAVLTAQSNAARQGILIRSGRALEMLAEVDAVVFDKTATLTQGRAAVVDIDVCHPSVDEAQLLILAASAEQSLDHPLAHAIVHRAQMDGVDIRPCTTWDYATGLGVTATIDGQDVQVGNRLFMEESGIDAGDRGGLDVEADGLAHSNVYVSADGLLIGRLHCADPVRAESADVIAHLDRRGIATLLLSGDSRSVSQAVAMDLGIVPEHVHAEVLPQRKVGVVQALQARGRRVAVVGDGVNDVAAMAHADVSIALGSATDLARETADIVLMQDDLRDLLLAIEIAEQSVAVIRQNRALVVVPNVAAIAYGALFVLNPVAGVVINNGSALAAALNSLRPLRGPSKTIQQK